MAKIVKIPSVELIDTKVVGVSKSNRDGSSRQDIIRTRVHENDPVRLVHEPNNPYDENAVQVLTMDGPQIGYLKSSIAPKVRSALDHDAKVIATVSWVSGHEIQGVGLRIELVS